MTRIEFTSRLRTVGLCTVGRLLVSVGLALGLVQFAAHAQAAALTFNGGNGSLSPSDSSGAWDYATTDWWNGTPAAVWVDGSDAVFGAGGVAGTVTIGSGLTVSPNSITFAPTSNGSFYTITGGNTGGSINTSGNLPITLKNNATIAASIVGNGGLTVNGNGKLILSGSNTYSGPTIVSGGTLQAGPFNIPVSDYGFDNATTSSGASFANNNNYRAVDYGGVGFNTPWTPTGSSWTFQNHAGIVTGNGGWGVPTPEPSGNQAAGLQYYDNQIPMAYQTLSFPAPGTYTISFQSCYSTAGNGNPSTVYVDFGTTNGAGGTTVGSYTPASHTAWNPYSFSFSVSAAGNYEVAFEGYASGSNYISLVDSVVETANLNMLPNGTALTVASGAMVDFKGAPQSVSSLSDGTPGAGGTLTNSAAGTTVLLTINPSGSSTFSGMIQNGVGGIGLVLNGPGTQVLAGSNTFSGATTITAGTLNLANANALKNSTVSVADGLVFSPHVGTFNVGGLSGPSNVALNDTSGSPVALSAGGNNANSAYSGVMSGPGSFMKTGSGTLFLANSSSYTGSTIIAGGTLKLPAPAGTVAATTYVVTASPGTPVGPLSVIGGLTPTSNTNPAPGQGANVGPTGPVSVLTDGINNTNHNAAAEASWYTIGNNTSLTYTLPASSQGFNITNLNLFSDWDDNGRSQINISNISYSTVGSPTAFNPIANTAIVTSNPGSSNEASYSASGGVMATNVYAIQINFGGQQNNFVGYGEIEVLGNAVAAAGSSNFLPTTTALQLGAASGNATLDLSGVNQQVASLSNYNGFTNGVVTSNGGPATLTLSATGGSTVFSGAIQNGSSSGVMSLVLSGSGLQVLAGANTYSGGTTISSGTLQLGTGLSGQDGSIASTSGVTNNSALVYNLFGNQTLSSYAINGSGSLTKLGPGALVVTTNNGYTGTTTVAGGALQIGNGGASGSISATSNVVDNASLIFSRNDNYGGSFTPVISGTGTLNVGGGTLTLAGVNTYTGATSVNSGVLVLTAGTNNLGSSLINVGSAGTLNVSGFGGGSGIALTSGQTLRGNGTVVGSVAALSGATVLSGTGAASGTGIGTLTLANNLNLAAGATVTGYLGTPGSGTASPGNAGVINVQGTLTLPSSGLNLSLLNNSGAGGLGSAGNGFYELFSYGSLTGNPSSAFPASNGAKLFTYYNPPGQIDVQLTILALNWTGTASSSWDTAGSTNWANGSTAASYLDGADVTFSDTNSITGGPISNSNVVIQAAGVQPNSVTFNNNAVNYTLSNASGTAGIAGSTGIVLSGSGTVNLQSPNSFQGPVAINAGILNVTNSAALGSSLGVAVASGGALQMQGNIALAAPLSLNGSGFAGSPAGALNSVSGTNSYAGAVTLGSPSTISAAAGQLTLTGGINTGGNQLTIGGAGNATISTLGISGSGGLTVAGPGTTTLLAASSYTGTTSVTGGVLAIPGGFSIPSTAVTVTGGSMVVQTAFNAPTGSVNLNGGVLQTPAWTGGTNTTVNFNGGTLQANASSPNFLNGNAAGNVNINSGGAVIDTQANNISILQPFTGSGGLNKKGGGTLTLDAASTYSGPTLISAGILKLIPGPAPLANDTFTSDATALIGTTSLYGSGNYTTALAFNQGANLTINGVTFNNTGTAPSGAGNLGSSWSVTGLPNNGATGNFPSGFPLASNQVTYSLLNRFYYGNGSGAVETIDLSGLVSGDTYEARLYYRSWGNAGDSRSANFVFSSGSGSTTLNGLNEDADANAHYLDYQFVASGGSMAIGINPPGAGSWHVYGFSNQLIPSAGSLPANTPLTIASGGTLDLNGQNQQVASLSGSGAVTTSAAGSSATLTLASAATGISTYSGTIGNGAGTVSLLLAGVQNSGEFLTGVNTFTGSVSVAENNGHYSSLVLANSGALLGATLVNANGVTFDKSVNPSAFTIGGLAGEGTLILANNGTAKQPIALSVGANNQNTIFSGKIEDGTGAGAGGSLIKVGNGTLTLAGQGAYTGATFINGGELLPDSPAAIPGNITFGGGALQYDANNPTDYSGSIFNSSGPIAIDTNGQPIYFGTTLDSSNTGGLTKLGAGALYLQISNAYSGPTTISGGTLNVSDPGAIPSGSSLTFAGGVLQYSAPNTVDYSSAPYGIVNSSGPIAVDTNGNNVTYAGVLGSSNSGGLTKIGAGTLVLGANNAYGGTTTVAGGVLQLGAAAGIPANSPLNLSSGTLDVNGFSPSFIQTSTFSASGTVTNSGPLASTISLSATSANMTIASLLTDGASPLGFSVSSLGGSNGYNFDFTNPNNTFSGGVNISNASARMYGTNANTAMGTGTITVSNSGFLMIWANTGSYAGSVTISNNFVLNTIGGPQISSLGASGSGVKTAIFADGAGGGAQVTILTGSIDLASNGGVDAYNGGNPDSLYISGPIYGPGALVKGINASNGGGLVTLANTANSYSGGTVINTGTLRITASGSLGTGNTITFGVNGTLQAANNLVLGATQQILIPSGAATLNSQNFTFVVPGAISGTGALTIAAGTSGEVVLSGANTYGGGTTINSGVVLETNTAALPGYATTFSASSVSVAAGATLAVQGGTLAGEFAPSDIDNVRTTANFSAGANLGIQVVAPESYVYNSSITDSISGALGIVKLGSGLLTLGGANSYSGGTTIRGGTLSLANAGAIPGAIAFAGGTLQYTASNTVDYSGVIANSTGPIAIDTNGLNMTFASPIASSNVGGLTKIGAGALTLTANNLYSGLTTVSGGTLQLGDGVANNGIVNGSINNNSALVIANPFSQIYGAVISGSGSVTKTGAGTLVLAFNQSYTGPTAINAGIVQLGSGSTDRFQNGGQFITVNSSVITSTPFTGNVLTLTDGNNSEARSAFYDAPLNVASPFTASFVYQATGTADGVTFMLQNDSRALGALGAPGGSLGYAGIMPSAAIELNIFGGASGGVGSNYTTGGTLTQPYVSSGTVNLASGDPIQVTLSYDGSNQLVETLTDMTTLATSSTTYAVGSLAATVSGSSAYVGFSGATGGLNATQTISDFTFTTGASNILPAATALSISGGTLDMFGANQTVASLSGPGTVTNSGSNLSTLTISGSSASNFSGTLENGAGGLALLLDGPGELILSGTNTYTGGTTVLAGTLVAASATALADGSSLTVGQGASSLFAPAVAGPAVAAVAAVASVPEPGTLALLAAAALAAGWKIRRRKHLRAN